MQSQARNVFWKARAAAEAELELVRARAELEAVLTRAGVTAEWNGGPEQSTALIHVLPELQARTLRASGILQTKASATGSLNKARAAAEAELELLRARARVWAGYHKQPTDEPQCCQCARRDGGHYDNEPATNKQPKPHHRRDLHRGNDSDILQRAERPQHEWLRIARRIWIGQRDRCERRIGLDRWFGCGDRRRRRRCQHIVHPSLRRLSNGQRVVQLICN